MLLSPGTVTLKVHDTVAQPFSAVTVTGVVAPTGKLDPEAIE